MTDSPRPSSPTMIRRLALFRDRWTSYGANTGVEALSDKLSVEELRRFEIFSDYDDSFLERISQDVSLAAWKANVVLFEEGTYLDLAFFIVSGEVEVALEKSRQQPARAPIFDLTRTSMISRDLVRAKLGESTDLTNFIPSGKDPEPSEITFLASMDFDLPAGAVAKLGPGEILGEIGALSGWPQSVTARTTSRSLLLQIRVPALRLMKRKSKALKTRLDELYRERALSAQLKSTPLLQGCPDLFISGLKEAVELVSCAPGETLVREGDPVDALFLVRSGFVKLAQRFGEKDLVVSYLSKGMTLGEVEILVEDLEHWECTATSVEYAELVKIPLKMVRDLVGHFPDTEELLWKSATARIKETGYTRRRISHAGFTEMALSTGLVQGNSMLMIDLDSCTRCDDCVRACAATHGGRARFVREGEKIDHLLVARSCYHCRDPVCLVGCPTGAIHRAGVGDVVEIKDAICIGCATCANNCPYDAIIMHDTGEVWPTDTIPAALRGQDRQVASKCDLCYDTGHDPACVTHCPQGCAFRVGNLDEIQELLQRKDGAS